MEFSCDGVGLSADGKTTGSFQRRTGVTEV